jgi:FkbM family methyltransferase
MKSLLGILDRSVEAFNRAPLWQSACRVWDREMTAATFDRWLYLRLHKFGAMGTGERAALQGCVRPGMTVVDVGSNLGLYTVLLSRLVGPTGRVLAFEPDPDLFSLLQRNCAVNGCTNVTAYNLALGSRHGHLTLHTMVINSGDNHLGDGGSQLFRRSVPVEMVSLDEIIPGLKPDLIKIDVQGWELDALKGMRKIIVENPHTEIYFEYWPAGFRRAGSSAAEIVSWLRELNFGFYQTKDFRPLTEPAMAELTHELTGIRHADLFASRSGAVPASPRRA